MQSNELIELAKHVQDSGGVILLGLDEKSGFAAIGVI